MSERELKRTLSAIPGDAYRHVRCFGLLGTYDDGLEWLKTAELKCKTKIVMSLGSSIGNFNRSDAAGFLQSFARVLGDNDQLLIGLDACKDAAKVQLAYNDSHGLTHRFYLQGLLYANDILGKPVFDVPQWNVIGQYDELNGRHQAFMSPACDVTVGNAIVHAGEHVRLEEAYKYSAAESAKLWTDARLRPVDQWSNRSGDYGTYDVINRNFAIYPAIGSDQRLFVKPVFVVIHSLLYTAIHMLGKGGYAQPLDAAAYASEPCPLLSEWTDLWALWDAVTRKMIPDEELLNKPIKLRNACIFYLGHIPTFLDMKIASQTDGINTDPKNYPKIFERGIDPDVDNPEQCHAHSEIPDEWPPLGEILTFQQRVRQRVTSLYESGAAAKDPKVQRVLWLGYEHEAMHLETLLYMLVQSEKTLPPPNTPVPNFDVLAAQADAAAVPNTWFTIPATTFEVGTNDPQTASGPKRYFGWDIETPVRRTAVRSFSASARPISNGEYAAYLEATSSTKLPAAWICSPSTNGHDAAAVKTSSTTPSAAFLAGKSVRTVYGAVPLSFALHWPASASYDELAGCAAHMGGRIPSQDEVLSIYRHSEALAAAKQADPANGTPAVNAHLINNGVRESPPASAAKELHAGTAFADLHGTNVGFQHWHPAPVTQLGGALGGRGAMGGVWEWTSTPLASHDGYEPMPLYQAYSCECT